MLLDNRSRVSQSTEFFLYFVGFELFVKKKTSKECMLLPVKVSLLRLPLEKNLKLIGISQNKNILKCGNILQNRQFLLDEDNLTKLNFYL